MREPVLGLVGEDLADHRPLDTSQSVSCQVRVRERNILLSASLTPIDRTMQQD